MSTAFDTAKLTKTIEELCVKKNISVKEMLLNCGLSRNVVDNLKKGSIPSVDKMAKIASYFGVPIDFLLGTGLFENWDKIKENKYVIVKSLYNFYPTLESDLELDLSDENVFVNVSNELLAKVEFDGMNVTLFPRVHPEDLKKSKEEMLKFNQEMLLNENFQKMNEEDKKLLIEFSEFLANKYKNETREK